MKAVKRRSLSVLTALMLVLSMFALVPEGLLRADAAIAYGIKIAGTEVTGINRNDILGNGRFSYDPETNTLFIKGDLSYGEGLGANDGYCIYDTDKNRYAEDVTILPINYIKNVGITVPEPKAGDIISEKSGVISVTPSDMNVSVFNNSSKKNKVSWTNPPYMIQEGVTEFKNGKTYTLRFKLAQSFPVGQDAPEAELSEKTSVKVNGRQAEFTGKDGFYYTYQLKFTVGGLKGDVDGNGVINMKDLATLQRYVNGWDVTINEANSDLDDSGSINMKDVAALQRLINSL